MLLMVALALATVGAPMGDAGADAAQATASEQSGEQSSRQGAGQPANASYAGPFSAQPLPPDPHEAIPRGYKGAWILMDDYPSAALRRNLQGRVGAILGVNSAGRTETCTIVQTSTHAILDEATCRSTLRRARFWPATGAGGEAIQGHHPLGTRWNLPADSDDELTTTESPQEIIDREAYTLQMSAQADLTVPATPTFSVDQSSLVEEEPTFPFFGVPAPQNAEPPGSAGSIISTQLFSLKVDNTGNITDCRFTSEYHGYVLSTSPVDGAQACQTVKDTVRFSPARNAMGQPMASMLYLVMKQRVPATVTPPAN